MAYMDRQNEVRKYRMRQVTKKIRAITGGKATINQEGMRAEVRSLKAFEQCRYFLISLTLLQIQSSLL